MWNYVMQSNLFSSSMMLNTYWLQWILCTLVQQLRPCHLRLIFSIVILLSFLHLQMFSQHWSSNVNANYCRNGVFPSYMLYDCRGKCLDFIQKVKQEMYDNFMNSFRKPYKEIKDKTSIDFRVLGFLLTTSLLPAKQPKANHKRAPSLRQAFKEMEVCN